MENKGLLFIPDISGFTRFVTEMEIEHSRHIIQELLEILIDSNEIGLEVSEVEGDAILFYRFGDTPKLNEIYKQVEKMFQSFHRHLRAYEYRRFCQCKACTSAIDLSLKVITHYGEFTGYNVKNFNKLIGKDVIVAHQLLKNDIDQHEYWLVTRDMLQDERPMGFADWMRWYSSAKKTDTGEIPFHYTQLSELKNNLPPDPHPSLEINDRVKVLSVSREYAVDVKKLFFTTVHFNFRPQWVEGVKAVDQVEHFLPGVGSRHRCVTDKGELYLYTSSFNYDPEQQITFSETDEKKKSSVYYILEKTGENKSRLTIELYLKKSLFAPIVFNMFMKKKLEAQFERSLINMEGLLKQIELPVEF